MPTHLMKHLSAPVIAVALMALSPPALTQGAGAGQTRVGRAPGGATNSCIPMNRETQDPDRDGCAPGIQAGDRSICDPATRDVDRSCDPMTTPSRLVFDSKSSQNARLPWPDALRVIHRFADGSAISSRVKSGTNTWMATDPAGRSIPGPVVGWFAREGRGRQLEVKVLPRLGQPIPSETQEDLARVAKAVAEARANRESEIVTSGVKCYICRNDRYGHLKCEVVPCDGFPQFE